MIDKADVLVTRKLPRAVEARLARDYAARFINEDKVFSADELVQLAQGAIAIIP